MTLHVSQARNCEFFLKIKAVCWFVQFAFLLQQQKENKEVYDGIRSTVQWRSKLFCADISIPFTNYDVTWNCWELFIISCSENKDVDYNSITLSILSCLFPWVVMLLFQFSVCLLQLPRKLDLFFCLKRWCDHDVVGSNIRFFFSFHFFWFGKSQIGWNGMELNWIVVLRFVLRSLRMNQVDVLTK